MLNGQLTIEASYKITSKTVSNMKLIVNIYLMLTIRVVRKGFQFLKLF